jgi:hypothetical protein
MSETQEFEPTANETEARQLDVRAELKKNLAEEFSAALAQQDALTEVQRSLLHSLITEQQISSTAILQRLRSTENQP